MRTFHAVSRHIGHLRPTSIGRRNWFFFILPFLHFALGELPRSPNTQDCQTGTRTSDAHQSISGISLFGTRPPHLWLKFRPLNRCTFVCPMSLRHISACWFSDDVET
ncbi:uncharacterized protein LY79DRAFT_88918 [Colletotrichum navitas]|uniref:Secreted protein n=1 Tax=Colletotrichum navitas TaxID=681940 RepID=A0AAD8Q6T2_9PEZI|nr:uncharacterized protein LY79DRAFT_88918 [Colletotrichum navitas]KAK1595709.1 hypothetical protein LY79DRAFT_88918 [Colletotrichum navitas]